MKVLYTLLHWINPYAFKADHTFQSSSPPIQQCRSWSIKNMTHKQRQNTEQKEEELGFSSLRKTCLFLQTTEAYVWFYHQSQQQLLTVCFVYQVGNDNIMIYITFREKNEGDISACILKEKFLSAKFVNNRKASY